MARLKDIGNGVQMVDLSNQLEDAKSQLGLVDLVNKIQRAPLDQQAAELDVLKKRQDLADQQMKFRGNAFLTAVSGDIEGANQIAQSVDPNLRIEAHPDLAKRNRGVLLSVNQATGQVQEVDPFQQFNVNERIKTEYNLIQKAREIDLSNKSEAQKWIRDTGLKLAEEGRVSDIKAGMQTAQAVVMGVQGAENAGVPITKMNDVAVTNRLRSAAAVTAANTLSQDPLNQSLQKKTAVPEKFTQDLISEKSYQDYLAAEILPRYRELQDTLIANPNLLNQPIQQVLKLIGANNPKFQAFQTLVGQGLFDKIKADSGAAFPEQEYERRKALLPNDRDTVQQGIAKISALLALSNTKAVNTLNGLEANNHNVSQYRRLFQGRDYGDLTAEPSEQKAQAFLNSLPSDVKADRAQFAMVLENASPNFRTAVQTELRKQRERYNATPSAVAPNPGIPAPQINLDRFNNIRSNKMKGGF